jgi:hypothetical protein
VKNHNLNLTIASRLEDIAAQVEFLYENGFSEEAALLRNEGLELAEAYDSEQTFLYIEDLTEA